MDWAETVRALRRKLRLKQGAFAEMIGVSQTYVSRLEAGLVGPAPHVAVAIETLLRDPRTRGAFGDLVATIGRIPFHCALIEPDARNGNRLKAISRPAESDLFGDSENISGADGVDQFDGQIDELMKAGFADGVVSSAVGHWFEQTVESRAWWTLYSPVRNEDGACHVFTVMRPLDGDERPADEQAALEIVPYTP